MGSLFSDIGNAIGYATSGAQRGRESREAGQALTNYQNLNPTINDAYQNIQANPQFLGATSQALNELGGVAGGTGLTPQEASALQAAQLSNAQQSGAATQAALGNAARSGTLNSGRALGGVLQAGQGATNANAQAGAEAAANSAAQRQQAMGQLGQLGTQAFGAQSNEQLAQAGGENAAQAQQFANALNQAKGEQSAEGTLIGINQGQAQGQQQLGGSIGDAVGQVASAAAGVPGVGSGGGGLSSLMGLVSPQQQNQGAITSAPQMIS